MNNFSLSSRKFPIKANETQKKFKCHYRNRFRCPLHRGKVIKSENYYILWCMPGFCTQKSDSRDLQAHTPGIFQLQVAALQQSLKLYKFIVITGSVWLALSRGTFYQLLSSAKWGFLDSFFPLHLSFLHRKKNQQNYSWQFYCTLIYGPCIYFLWCKINFMEHLLSVQSV